MTEMTRRGLLGLFGAGGALVGAKVTGIDQVAKVVVPTAAQIDRFGDLDRHEWDFGLRKIFVEFRRRSEREFLFEKALQDSVWVAYRGVKVRVASVNTPLFRRELEVLRGDGVSTTLGDIRAAQARSLVLDWQGFADADGREVEFSQEAAERLMESNPRFHSLVSRTARDLTVEELANAMRKPRKGHRQTIRELREDHQRAVGREIIRAGSGRG